jgi:hypothetical protein
VKRHLFLLATLALVGVVAFAAGSVASAKPALAGSAAGATRAPCHADAVGDAAPELGLYGWILVGLDTDRNTLTGGGRGDELLAFANGGGTTLTRWVDGRFTRISPTTASRRRFRRTSRRARASPHTRAARPAAAAARHGLPPCQRAGARRVPTVTRKEIADEQEAQDHGRSTPVERQRRSGPSH